MYIANTPFKRLHIIQLQFLKSETNGNINSFQCDF